MEKVSKQLSISSVVNQFPEKGGWHFVRVPRNQTDKLRKGKSWGFIPIKAQIGDCSWDTSLLPMGDGSYFIALNAKMRKQTGILLGDKVCITYTLK